MITADFLKQVCGALAHGKARQAGVDTALREAFPGMPFTLCSDNDIPSRLQPLARGEGFALYGINTAGHCAALTSSADTASGLAIALTDDED
ncbi:MULTISPECIES: DUF6129 family protein [Niveibacterium]|uniref:DUF6129 domain-containing protein n=1 Tax=Niveibacterium microcysteis TaxID=2811415 RepID=A0ABX7M099_9RHOO|nr:DUF6129 family protein [Niveibacterium microcysteis]QSI75188.1 hypothetical protein JY500_11685 [Niveibacterium microcysteis]